MAELNFPANPTDGQIYGNYTWSAATGAWLARPVSQQVAISSPTPPANPVAGTVWYNTNDGTTYIYYYDGNTYQWVESTAPISANGYYSPNYIINGGFDIWQRATSATLTNSTGYVSADRWMLQANPATTFSRLDDGSLTGIKYGARVQRTAGATVANYSLIGTSLETVNSVPLAGKTVTFSFYARKGANLSGIFYADVLSGTGVDQNQVSAGYTGTSTVCSMTPSLTTSWVRYTISGVVPANATELAIRFYDYWSGTAGAADYFDVAGVQLEEGNAATPFRRNANSIQGELAACQRYFVSFNSNKGSSFYQYYASGSMYNTVSGTAYLPLPVEMRIPPSVSTSSAASFQILTSGANVQITSISGGDSNALSLGILINSASTLAADAGFTLRGNGIASYILASAEL